MYYRRKVLLSILEQSGGSIGKIDLQKILFLISQEQISPCFDFVPYKYGCFSFQADKDLEVLSNHYKLVSDDKDKWHLRLKERYFDALKPQDQQIITRIFKENNPLNTNQLIKKVYAKAPYYTINTRLKLTPTQKRKQQQQLQQQDKAKCLFSIGYQGLSIDAYLNLLVENNIKLLCDVRKNPISMKYGFSKKQLENYCQKLDISYQHFPNLGIDSGLRQNLNAAADYIAFFKNYKLQLKEQHEDLQAVNALLNEYKRIALTCFELDHKRCHRSILMDYYTKDSDLNFNNL